MLAIAIILYAVGIAGMVFMAARFLRGTVPLGYHREIIERDGQVTGGLTLVLTALYRILAGGVLCAAVLMAALVVGPLAQGQTWPVLILFGAGLIVALPAIILPLRVERASGVRTPWRLGAVLLCVFLRVHEYFAFAAFGRKNLPLRRHVP